MSVLQNKYLVMLYFALISFLICIWFNGVQFLFAISTHYGTILKMLVVFQMFLMQYYTVYLIVFL